MGLSTLILYSLIGVAAADVTLDRAVDAYSFLFPLMLAEQTRLGETTPENTITNVPIFPPPEMHKVSQPVIQS